MTTTNQTQEHLDFLAGVEIECGGCNGVTGWDCTTCKDTGTVAKYPWARGEPCGDWADEFPHYHGIDIDHDKNCIPGTAFNNLCETHRRTCPGWRTATLADVDLEAVLEACGKAINYEPYSIGWDGPGYDSEYWDFEGYPLADYRTPESSPEDAHRLVGQGDTPKQAAIAAVVAAEIDERAKIALDALAQANKTPEGG